MSGDETDTEKTPGKEHRDVQKLARLDGTDFKIIKGKSTCWNSMENKDADGVENDQTEEVFHQPEIASPVDVSRNLY